MNTHRHTTNCITLILLVMGLVSFNTTQARDTVSNFRCKNAFVSLGDSKALVFLKCGDPLFREVISGTANDKTEEWTYRPKGNRSFLRILTFTRGKLTRIERGKAISR